MCDFARTETCSFSEGRIYPGHGSRYIRRDGSAYVFINAKSKSLFLQRKKPTKIVWTLGWRRMNKKIKVEEVARRRARKTTKIQRAILGVSADDVRCRLFFSVDLFVALTLAVVLPNRSARSATRSRRSVLPPVPPFSTFDGVCLACWSVDRLANRVWCGEQGGQGPQQGQEVGEQG